MVWTVKTVNGNFCLLRMYIFSMYTCAKHVKDESMAVQRMCVEMDEVVD